jgi:photosystem II stability/assembly factor-like uncharacterized protein
MLFDWNRHRGSCVVSNDAEVMRMWLYALADHGLEVILPGPQWQVRQISSQPRGSFVTFPFHTLTVDPTNPAVVYLLANGAPVRSDDWGQSWRPMSGYSGPRALAMTISAGDRCLYVGGTDAVLFRSSDGGTTWTALAGLQRLCSSSGRESLAGASVWMIAVSPADPTMVMVVLMGKTNTAVVSSTDGGQTWNVWEDQPANTNGPIMHVAWHPRVPGYAYAVGGAGVGRTRDGGRTWQLVGEGLAPGQPVAVAADPDDPDGWYLALERSTRSRDHRDLRFVFRKSGDRPWAPLPWPAGFPGDGGISGLVVGRGGWIFVAMYELTMVVSGDGGRTWSRPLYHTYTSGITMDYIRELALVGG